MDGREDEEVENDGSEYETEYGNRVDTKAERNDRNGEQNVIS
jgi:hypothetical protein